MQMENPDTLNIDILDDEYFEKLIDSLIEEGG
jgi:hypothetical protein